jgi:hypothetical protein
LHGDVEVNEGVKVHVAVKGNVRVDVLVEVHDPVTTAQDAVFYGS